MAYCCKYCNASFQRKTMLDRHECSSEAGRVSHTCEDCGESFNSATGLSNHNCKKKNSDTEDNSALFKCSYCKAHFINENTLRVHERVHTGDLPYKCQECGAKFPYHSNLRSHLRIHNDPIDRPHKCDECGAKFSQMANLEAHLRTHGPDRTTTCNKCLSIIPDNCTHTCKQETGECFYVCKECNARFTVKNTLEVHMRTHTGEKPYRCTHCGERFSQTGALHSHIRTHTTRLTHECGECSQRFRTEDELRVHVRTHDQFILHKCKICFGAFANEKRLLLHMRQKHAQDEDMLQCDRCSRSFSTGSELQTHIREMHSEADSTHSQEADPDNRKYYCSKCSEIFLSPIVLQSHLRAKHPLSSSPYLNTDHRCDDCGSKFTTSNRLIAHRRTKHPEKIRPMKTEPSATITSPVEMSPQKEIAQDDGLKHTGMTSLLEQPQAKRKEITSAEGSAASYETTVKKHKSSYPEFNSMECHEMVAENCDFHVLEGGCKCENSGSKCSGHVRCTCLVHEGCVEKKHVPTAHACERYKCEFVCHQHLKTLKCKHQIHVKHSRKRMPCMCTAAKPIASCSGTQMHKCPECRIKFSQKHLVKLHLDSVHQLSSRECSACTKICVQSCSKESNNSKEYDVVCSSCNESDEDEMEVDSTTNNDFEESSSEGSDVDQVHNVESNLSDGDDKTRKIGGKSNINTNNDLAGKKLKEKDDSEVVVIFDAVTQTSKPKGKTKSGENSEYGSSNARKLPEDNDMRLNVDTCTGVDAVKIKKPKNKVSAETSVSMQKKGEQGPSGVTAANPTLADLVPRLITVLVGNSRLEDFGWPGISVDELLDRVIRHSGEEPAVDAVTMESKLSENCKILFEASIGKEETASLLLDKSVEEVIVEVIALSEQDCAVEA